MTIRIVLSVFVHLLSAAAAFLVFGTIHVLSGRALWAILPMAYEVREISGYLIDVMPYFIVVFAVLSITLQKRLGIERLPFRALLALAFLAVPLTILFHQPFFPWSYRSLVILVMVALYYVSALAVAQGVLDILVKSRGGKPLFPSAPAIGAGLMLAVIISVLYVGGFSLAQRGGYIDEEGETYRRERVRSPSDTHFIESDKTADRFGRAPEPGLFVVEDALLADLGGLSMGSASIVDVNGDGAYDIVASDRAGTLSLWINQDGILKKAAMFIENFSGQGTSVMSFADYDRDGLMDMLLAQPKQPAQSTFETVFLKKLFWYFSRKPAVAARLFRQVKPGQWQDVTKQAFPDGAPTQFRKAEPILWFDFNGDGRLDFVWSGYSHPHGGGQSLYIQNLDGTFSDKIDQTLRWSPGRIYAEGSDIADIDGDGDIDVFAYGYLFRNDGGVFTQVCGDEMLGIYCDAEARNEEGALLEDIDGNGTLDLALSYHGVGGIIPKYFLQLFRGDKAEPGKFVREKAFEKQFYGFNTYLRGKDFDFNGRPDVLTNDPGRLLTFFDDKWLDLLPDVSPDPKSELWPLGWLDVDEDGDWDFLAFRVTDEKVFLFRNQLNPERFMKISATGAGGVENQYGATLKIGLPDGRTAIASYRPMGGYQGVTDPRLVYSLQPGHEYRIEACFPSIGSNPSAHVEQPGVDIAVTGVSGRCVTYTMVADETVTRLDLALTAGQMQ